MAVPTLSSAASLRDGRWYRLHPLTPVLQGGLVVAGVVGFIIAALWETVVLRVLLLASGEDGERAEEVDTVGNVIDWFVSFGAFVVLAGVLGIVILWLQWRAHVVRMDDDVIEVKKGIIVRSSRRARRDRVNTVGVRRPLIPRLLGLAKLDIQAAGNDANVVLAYLPHSTAHDVRREILVPTPGDIDSVETPPADATRVVEVPLFRYLASLVLSIETVVFSGALVVSFVAALSSGEVVTWLGVVIVGFVYVAFLADRFFRVGTFVVDRVGSDLRVSLGLLSTSVETIPPARIHALQISQPWPWRVVGWWRIDANLASSPGAQVSKAPAHTVIAPVATMAEVMKIVSLCMPVIDTDTHRTLISQAFRMTHSQWVEANPVITQSVSSPARARYRIPLSFRVNGGGLVENTVVVRTGWWIARLAIIPLARAQSSGVSQGPWHRALGLLSFSIDSVSGPVATKLRALDYAQAERWWAAVRGASITAIASAKPKSARRRKVSS